MVAALCTELRLRREEFESVTVNTIYFGGGTPSMLDMEELRRLMDEVFYTYNISPEAEITLEANPDDLTPERLRGFRSLGINRLSVGVQSFFDDDLCLMNRTHTAHEAWQGVVYAKELFDNISIDLIYGIPNMSLHKWRQNIDMALSLGVPHISAYALTVEPKTALSKFVQTHKVQPPDDEAAREHYSMLIDCLAGEGFVHYEISNFGKPNYFSQNNTAYWQGKRYMGIGPSAHSYNTKERSWNVSNNSHYINSITKSILPREVEELSLTDMYNEYIMTGLRTCWGVSLAKLLADYGQQYQQHFQTKVARFVETGFVDDDRDTYKLSREGMFVMDGIVVDLFF